MSRQHLTDSAFLVLALLAEREAHGYEIHKLVHRRGFRLWTTLKRSSIYSALTQLEKDGLIGVRVTSGEGPDRKVYRITRQGRARLAGEAARHLAEPEHPRNELDLGIYGLPFMSAAQARKAFNASLGRLRERRAFLDERMRWCLERDLRLPALAFERPLLALDAEIHWLQRIAQEYEKNGTAADRGQDWAHFSDTDLD